jgi:hypothetical protein
MAKAIKVGQGVAVPSKMTTARVVGINAGESPRILDIELDPPSRLVPVPETDVEPFRWKARQQAPTGFIYTASAWSSMPDKRHFRLHAHRLREDGSFGGRIILYEKINGVLRDPR